ncbi:MAG: ATP-binding cassette domain-containing protein [Thermoanaerobaculia bacterium]
MELLGFDSSEAVSARQLLQVRDLVKQYGSTKVINKMKFNLESGSSLLIKGPSGCGKTTLLRCIALLEDIQGGEIIFGGKTILTRDYRLRPQRSVRLGIAMVFQQLFLWGHLTVLDNVALPLWLRRDASRASARKRAWGLLDSLGVGEKIEEYPSSLSGGQRQRVALARALIHEPQLLLLDEITASLDKDTALKVFSIIEEVNKKGTSVILVSHADFIPPTLRQSTLVYDPMSQAWKSDKSTH